MMRACADAAMWTHIQPPFHLRLQFNSPSFGMLEVWTVPLINGAYGAVLFNRSPAPDAITLAWSDLDAWGTGVANTAPFAVRDVWAAADRGTFRGSYTAATVPAHGVVMLVLTPSA